MAAKKKSPEFERFMEKLRAQIKTQLGELVDAQTEDAFEAYRSGLSELLESDPEAKLGSYSMKLGLGVTWKPGPDGDVLVGSALSYGVRRKVEHTPARVSFQDDLPGMED